jgi:hypothetical protein
MHRRHGHHDTRLGKPWADFCAMVRTAVVTPEMNRADLLVNLPVQRVEKVDALALALPGITVPVALARTGVTGRTEIEGPCTPGLVLVAVRKRLRLGWPGRRVPRSRLSGGLLVHGQDQCIAMPRPRVELAQGGHCGREAGRPAAAWERATHDGARVCVDVPPAAGVRGPQQWRSPCPRR